MPHVRVHDLKHTFSMRLLAADVPFNAHQILLGHTPLTVTGRYTHAALRELAMWAERAVEPGAVDRYLARAVDDDWAAAIAEDQERNLKGAARRSAPLNSSPSRGMNTPTQRED